MYPVFYLDLHPIFFSYQYILARPSNWCVQTCSLIFRCQHETESTRKIERTLLQLEVNSNLQLLYLLIIQEIINEYDYTQPSSSFRLEYFYSTPMYPTWKLKVNYLIFFVSSYILFFQSDIANIYVKLGLINNALDLYLYLKKWSDVITCYQLLKKLSLVNFLFFDS